MMCTPSLTLIRVQLKKILSIMYGGVHFQECYNRDGGYCSNMIIICRISLFTVYYIVKN